MLSASSTPADWDRADADDGILLLLQVLSTSGVHPLGLFETVRNRRRAGPNKFTNSVSSGDQDQLDWNI